MFTALMLLAVPAIVPLPRSLTVLPGTYALPQHVAVRAASAAERNVAAFTERFLRKRGIAVRIVREDATAQIRLNGAAKDRALGAEGYHLRVDSSGIEIDANGGPGLFYGLQTLEQLVPASGAPAIRDIDIRDIPAFAWRGIHLDVSRHFFPVSVVERYINVAAHYKLNVFHWHLTDDQGWRIQIQRYPRLTSVGACRSGSEVDHDPALSDGIRYCGYYTQDQIRQVVAYAARRYVTVVPEIEMPGHSAAAIAAYPYLGCTGKQIPVSVSWGGSDAICPTPRAIRFEENVLSEIMQLFPSKYIHTGGDEVLFGQWKRSAFVTALMKRKHLQTYPQVQGYFERRIERFIRSKGRIMVGWDEILNGGVSRSAVVISWRGTAGGARAARRGNDTVMSPDGPLYLSWGQGDPADEPPASCCVDTPQMVYAFNPIPPGLTPQQAKHIIGVQGSMWTEWVPTASHLFYMLLPRELALAEDAWTPEYEKNWSSFEARTGPQYLWLEAHGYNFRIPNPSFTIDAPQLSFAGVSPSVRTIQAYTRGPDVTVTLTDDVPGAAIHYTLDGSTPSARSLVYGAPLRYALKPNETVDVTAVAVLPDGRVSTPSELLLARR